MFYYKFIESDNSHEEQWWTKNATTPAVLSWMGNAFELICLRHHNAIKQKLGLEVVSTALSSWHCKPDDAVGCKLGAEISHNATLSLLVEVVVSHIDIVGESGLQIGVTDNDAERVGDIGDRLQLSHRRLRRARAVVGLQ